MRSFGRSLVIVALCFAVGLHWCALQSVAWTTMVIEFSKEVPFTQAVSKALDGRHPCSLCRAVQTGRKSEQKSDSHFGTKMDFYCAISPGAPVREFASVDYTGHEDFVRSRNDSPPTPPPRQGG